MSSPFADQGTAAHAVLEEALIAIYEYGIPFAASASNGRTIHLEAEQAGDHESLGPSGAKRWMTCPGSVRVNEEHPEPLREARDVVLDQGDTVAIQACLDYVAERVAWITANYGPVVVRAERKVSSAKFTGSTRTNGTSDIALIADGYCEHIDYKHGAGVAVTADDPQNALYFLGTCAEYATRKIVGIWVVPFQKARLTVVQPRCDKIEPRIRSVEIEDVSAWLATYIPYVIDRITDTENPNAQFIASDGGCRWCNIGGGAKYTGAPVCAEYTRFSLQQMGIVMEGDTDGRDLFQQGSDLAARDLYTLTEEQVVAILDIRDTMAGVLAAVEAHGLDQLLSGQAGDLLSSRYKPVRGRSTRQWGVKEEDEWNRRLGKLKVEDPETGKQRALKKSERYILKRDTPKGIEGKLKFFNATKITLEAFRTLIDKPLGKLTIAPIDDKRDAVQPQTGQDSNSVFDDVPDLPAL